MKSQLLHWIKRRGHHLIFGFSLASLALLLLWWSIFLRRAILQEYELHSENLEFRSETYGTMLGHFHTDPLEPGPFVSDPRFEIVLHQGELTPMASRLLPRHPDYIIRPREDHLQEVEERLDRRMFMMIGEGSLLSILLLVSFVMLYRLISVERRSARELQEFWSRTTHEIKTPITGLKNFLQTLKTHTFEREELIPLVDLALSQVERQQQLAQNLLVGQRLEQDTIGLNMVNVNLPEFVRRFIRGHGVNLADKDVKLTINCREDLEVRGDPDAMHIILDNLTDNAIKYGGENLKLVIDVAVSGGMACITFADNGPGLAGDMLKNIFEAYRRLTDELPEGEHGTGMGLFISRQLARKMGGDLVAFSDGKGYGSSFRLSMRVA